VKGLLKLRGGSPNPEKRGLANIRVPFLCEQKKVEGGGKKQRGGAQKRGFTSKHRRGGSEKINSKPSVACQGELGTGRNKSGSPEREGNAKSSRTSIQDWQR